MWKNAVVKSDIQELHRVPSFEVVIASKKINKSGHELRISCWVRSVGCVNRETLQIPAKTSILAPDHIRIDSRHV